MLDRTKAPPFKSLKSIKLPEIKQEIWENNIPIYWAGFASQDILKLELVFNAGSAFEKSNGISSLFSKLILGGTNSKSSTQLIEELDQYGGFIEVISGVERLHIVLFGLKKYLGKYLNVIRDILENSNFPEKELELQRKIASQGLKLNLEKSTYLASRTFKKLIFGENNPYGKILEQEHLDKVTQNDLMDFYSVNIQGNSFKLFVSGNIGNQEITLLKEYFGKQNYQDSKILEITFDESKPQNSVVEKPEKMQSTIRIGRPLFDRKHPDFFKMMVTNTAFGGYFGSRLMKNIREDKGYTYGISSSIHPLHGYGYLLIGSDVVKENTVNTIREIEKEIDIIQSEQLSQDEIETVKNYMCGSYAGSITTAFEIMDKHKNLILADLPEGYYDNFIDKIRDVETSDVLQMSQTYFDKKTMTEVVVGERI